MSLFCSIWSQEALPHPWENLRCPLKWNGHRPIIWKEGDQALWIYIPVFLPYPPSPPPKHNTSGQRKFSAESIPGSRQDSHIAPNLSCAHRTTCRKLICNHNVCKYAPWEPCKRPLYQHPNALAVNFPIYKSNSQVYTALSRVCLWLTSTRIRGHQSLQIHCWWCYFPRFWMVPMLIFFKC